MTTSLDSQLYETLRDALVAYTLDEVVPNAAQFTDARLSDKLKTANDLYEYLLLDVQVSQNVQTSPVASAIASLQQYINGALMSMEPGYETKVMEEHRIRQWRDIDSQYPIWAADREVQSNPELYIDPSLRLHKSMYFQQLENDLNQNRINVDTAQEAIKNYLTRFEEVANLTIINGYVSTDDFRNGMYYFIGKSRAEDAYYWRSVDMSQRSYKTANGNADRPKFDYPQPGAWSDWHKAQLPISASAIERTLRPVFFNNRLFVFWVEHVDSSPEVVTVDVEYVVPPDPSMPLVEARNNPMFRLNLVYEKYDGSWSVPHTLIEAWSDSSLFKTQDPGALIESISVQDHSPETMFVAMYAGYTAGASTDGADDEYAFLRTARIDKNFNVTPLFPTRGRVPSIGVAADIKAAYVLNTARLYALDNRGRLQFKLPAFSIGVKSIETTSPHQGGHWNYAGWQAKIANPISGVDIKYNKDLQRIEFGSRILGEITEPTLTKVVEFFYHFDGDEEKCRLVFVYSSERGEGEFQELLPGSMIENASGEFISRGGRFSFIVNFYLGPSFDGFLRDDWQPFCTIPVLPQGATASIAGKKVHRGALDLLGVADSYRYLGNISVNYLSGTITKHYPYLYGLLLRPDRSFDHIFQRPVDPGAPIGISTVLYRSSRATVRHAPDTQVLSLPIDSETLLPDWNTNWPAGSRKIPLHHGIMVIRNGYQVGSALKMTQVELRFVPKVGTLLIAPRLNTRASPTLGVAEFIDFSGSGIQMTDGSSTVRRQPIRMNTLFARELINKANIALENLLAWATQGLEEPPLEPQAGNSQMDFHGANGKYFWEMFLHLPFMVSHRMNQEQQFDAAEQWLGFIFDPSRKADSSGRPDYWNVRPLMEDPVEAQMDYATRAPSDPDGIASSHPVYYRKAVYLHYLKNLQDRGDTAYRQLTPDSLGEAKLWYVRILDLLGPRPDVKLADHWTPMKLSTLSQSTSAQLRAFEQRFNRPDVPPQETSLLHLRTFSADPTLSSLDNAYLRQPFNRQLVQTWDTLESRLDNLRNNRTLDGKPLSLPLFAAPLDPRALLAAFGQGAAAGGAARLLAQDVPPYRFVVMHQRARAAVDTLIQFGHTLLSVIERKEQAALQELQQHQLWEFSQFAIELQEQALVIDEEQRKALEASKAVAQDRWAFYDKLAEQVVSPGETAAAALYLAARVALGVKATANAVVGGLKVAPNSVGGGGGGAGGLCVVVPSAGAFAYTSVGGWRLEGVPEIVHALATGVAQVSHATAESIDRYEHFRQRHVEWKQARDQAALEIAHIEAQLHVAQAQSEATRVQLRQAEAARAQAKTAYEFLGKRFTNTQLYQWLNAQFSTFYYQAFDRTLTLCLAAEACWQFELADFSRRFIQSGGWNDSRRGLGAGEALKLQLMTMDSAYLARGERALEITKTVSLRRLRAMDPDPQLVNKEWEAMHAGLMATGVGEFELSAKMFEDDYPRARRRRIRRIGVSLPIALGPYEDVCVTLTQTWSAVELGDTLKENLRASQQIVVSHGANDDGQFTSVDDGRYGPFVGTGAISRWVLHFTEQDLEQRNRHIESLTDIIVHMNYTAAAGQE